MVWLLLLAAAAPVVSQAPAPAEPGGSSFREEVSVGYVLVPVTVRSRDGFVTDLARGDFSLTVDGRPVAIDSFERGAEVPVRLALLQDLSGSMGWGNKLARSGEVVRCLLEQLRPRDQAALATFAGRRLRVEVPFSADSSPILESLEGWRAYGVTALHDAVARIPEIAASRSAPNAAAVLVTDGVENASDLDPAAAREIVRRARIPVYVLGFVMADGAQGAGLARYAGVLRLLAAGTGGRYYPLGRLDPVEAACREIVDEIRARYVLGFATGAAGPAAYHRIRVAVARRGARIGHRAGYTGPPPE